jgi:hypothetical protein
MTTFDDRQKTFEKKFERDQDLQFKVNARRKQAAWSLPSG